MRIIVTSVRAGRTPWADEACADYARRLGRYFPFEEALLRPGSPAQDAARALALLPGRGRLFAVDERGEQITSEELAVWIEQAAAHGFPAILFAIGGANGHDARMRDGAHRILGLSRMVLNHAVARVVLLEQLYRACTIRAGEPYHHGGNSNSSR